jgi:hypothetical protein
MIFPKPDSQLLLVNENADGRIKLMRGDLAKDFA